MYTSVRCQLDYFSPFHKIKQTPNVFKKKKNECLIPIKAISETLISAIFKRDFLAAPALQFPIFDKI